VHPSLEGVEEGIAVLGSLAACGVRVLNPAGALLACHDKLLTARLLRRAGVAHPRTAHLTSVAADPHLDGPLVVKPRFGSWGREVTLCRDRVALRAALEQIEWRPWFASQGALVQELVPPAGHDLRIVIAGGRAVGAARRTAARGEWRTNVALGATIEPTVAPAAAVELATRAALAVGADLVGVDLLPDGEGGWIVLELNGAVDFRPVYSPTGDVFAAAAEALLEPRPAELALS
jgi:[lysine-biosynthesis-protein LysW]--L-2-aminoadipate ligase